MKEVHNTILIPPGYYMLFLVSALSQDPNSVYPLMGCSSIAKIVKIEYLKNTSGGKRDEKS